MPEDIATQDSPRHAHLVGLLTFTSGCVDVVTLMVIGGAFTSVVTGNIIFVGRAVGTSSVTPALHAVLAVAGYIAGVAAGSRIRHVLGASGPESAWPRSSTIVLAVEWVILAAVNVAWMAAGAAPGSVATDVLLIAAALALGMQGAAARGVRGNPSTTYMTGALTALVEALTTGGRRTADASAAAGLGALVVGAACGALLVAHAPWAALLPALAALLLVVLIKLRDHHGERPPAPLAEGGLGVKHLHGELRLAAEGGRDPQDPGRERPGGDLVAARAVLLFEYRGDARHRQLPVGADVTVSLRLGDLQGETVHGGEVAGISPASMRRTMSVELSRLTRCGGPMIAPGWMTASSRPWPAARSQARFSASSLLLA
jgi:uncharacterized membrane protein YoaK (UPF0700 family)